MLEFVHRGQPTMILHSIKICNICNVCNFCAELLFWNVLREEERTKGIVDTKVLEHSLSGRVRCLLSEKVWPQFHRRGTVN